MDKFWKYSKNIANRTVAICAPTLRGFAALLYIHIYVYISMFPFFFFFFSFELPVNLFHTEIGWVSVAFDLYFRFHRMKH